MGRWGAVILLLLVGLLLPQSVLAQGGADACRAAVLACDAAGLDQVCYGAPPIDVQQGGGDALVQFSAPGDVVAASAVDSLRLSDSAVVVMRLQDGMPSGEVLTVLAYGDLHIRPGEPVPPYIGVNSRGVVNVRRGPSIRENIAGQLSSGQSVVADGRLEDSSWLRIQWEGAYAWVFTDLVTPAGDVAALDVVDPDAELVRFGPMQAFYLTMTEGAAACGGAPSGLLVQTPQDTEGFLLINEVRVRLNGTALVQADASLRVCTVDGYARLFTHDDARLAPEGTCVSAPLDPNRAAIGPFNPIDPFDAAAFNLPLESLPLSVVMAPARSAMEIAQLSLSPVSGLWQVTFDDAQLACGEEFGLPVDMSASSGQWQIDFAADGAQAVAYQPDKTETQYLRTTPDTFTAQAAADASQVITWRMIDGAHMQGLLVQQLSDECTASASFEMLLAGG